MCLCVQHLRGELGLRSGRVSLLSRRLSGMTPNATTCCGRRPENRSKKGGSKSGTRRCLPSAIGKHLWGGCPPGENFLVVWVVVFLLSASLVFRSVVLVLGAVVRPSCRVWSSGLVVCFRLPGAFLSVFQKGDDPRTDLSARHLLTPVVQECDMLWP